MAEPLDPAVREKIIDLAKTGEFSRNGLARELAVSPATVSRVCQAEGITFDRTQTAIAVKAAQIDHSAKRAVINTRILAELSRALVRLDQPVTVRISAGNGKVHTFTDASPSPRDLRDLSTAVAQLAAAHGRLAEVDARFADQDKLAEAGSTLDQFMHAVGTRAILVRMREDGIDVDKYLNQGPTEAGRDEEQS